MWAKNLKRVEWVSMMDPFPLFMEPISLVYYYIWQTRTNISADRQSS